MKLIKGKSYIFFGNFPNCEDVADKLSKELDITAKAFLSKTDTTSVLEYCDTDIDNVNKELNDTITELKKSNEYLGNECKEYDKLKLAYETSLEALNAYDDDSKSMTAELKKFKEDVARLDKQVEHYKKNYSQKWFK